MSMKPPRASAFRGANGQALAYVYFDDPRPRSTRAEKSRHSRLIRPAYQR
jgi:hypothetical protein